MAGEGVQKAFAQTEKRDYGKPAAVRDGGSPDALVGLNDNLFSPRAWSKRNHRFDLLLCSTKIASVIAIVPRIPVTPSRNLPLLRDCIALLREMLHKTLVVDIVKGAAVVRGLSFTTGSAPKP